MLKKVVLLLAMLALLLGVAPAFAQDGMLGLNPDDQALLDQANTYTFDSLAFDYSFTMSVNNQTLSFTGTGLVGAGADGPLARITFTGGGMADLEGTGTPQEVRVDNEFRVVGNMLYIADNASGGDWIGINLEQALSEAMGEDGLPPELMGLLSGDMSAMGDMGSAMNDVNALLESGFAQMSRLPNATVNGRDTAHFQLTLDFSKLLDSNILKDVLVGAGQLSGTQEEIDQQFQFFGSFLGMFFQNMAFSFDQFVATDTPRVERGLLNFSIKIPAMSADTEEMSISLALDVTMTAYNPPVAVDAPASFTELDPQQLMSGMGDMGF